MRYHPKLRRFRTKLKEQGFCGLPRNAFQDASAAVAENDLSDKVAQAVKKSLQVLPLASAGLQEAFDRLDERMAEKNNPALRSMTAEPRRGWWQRRPEYNDVT
ncbi:MAG TPA: hypothetical protein VMT80_02300 [Candidatus Paceibacterota bacterium]|nr:hypothetical protein [Candidatus Paceibacterota bacterium]